MRLIKLDLGGLARSLIGGAPTKGPGDAALIKIVIQIVRATK